MTFRHPWRPAERCAGCRTKEIRVNTREAGHTAQLAERAYHIRRNALRMGEVQGQGYIGQALDIADVLAVAYLGAMRYRADDPPPQGPDRVLLSKRPHASSPY